MLIAVSTEELEAVVAYEELAPSSETEVSTVPYNESEDRRKPIEWHQYVDPEDKKRKINNWQQETQIYDKV